MLLNCSWKALITYVRSCYFGLRNELCLAYDNELLSLGYVFPAVWLKRFIVDVDLSSTCLTTHLELDVLLRRSDVYLESIVTLRRGLQGRCFEREEDLSISKWKEVLSLHHGNEKVRE